MMGTPETEQSKRLSVLSAQLALNFLLSYGLRTTKSIRGPLQSWVQSLLTLFLTSSDARHLFAERLLQVKGIHRQCILENGSMDLRTSYSKILSILVNTTTKLEGFEAAKVLMSSVLKELLPLLARDVAENWKGFPQYFKFLVDYASLGIKQREHLMVHRAPVCQCLLTSVQSLHTLEVVVAFVLRENAWNKYQHPDYRYTDSPYS